MYKLSKSMHPKKKFPSPFSPLYIDTDILKSSKMSAIYKFNIAFFPFLVPSILRILMDMENHSHRIIAAIKPQERKNLIKELEGITVEIRYRVKDRGNEMVTLPINISPAKVLKNAVLGKHGTRYSKKTQQEINNILISFIIKEAERKI